MNGGKHTEDIQGESNLEVSKLVLLAESTISL